MTEGSVVIADSNGGDLTTKWYEKFNFSRSSPFNWIIKGHGDTRTLLHERWAMRRKRKFKKTVPEEELERRVKQREEEWEKWREWVKKILAAVLYSALASHVILCWLLLMLHSYILPCHLLSGQRILHRKDVYSRLPPWANPPCSVIPSITYGYTEVRTQAHTRTRARGSYLHFLPPGVLELIPRNRRLPRSLIPWRCHKRSMIIKLFLSRAESLRNDVNLRFQTRSWCPYPDSSP